MPDREKVKTGIFEMLQRNTWKDIDKERHRFQPVLNDALALLKEQPKIVRCKDCKYYDHFNGCMSWHDVNSNNDNWYCADGERRDDNA